MNRCTLVVLALGNLSLLHPIAQADQSPRDNVVRSAQSGLWSAAKTWEGGKVPAAGDKVLVREAHIVTYDVQCKSIIRSLFIVGTLIFARDCDTELNVGLIKIQHSEQLDENGFDCVPHPKDAKLKAGEGQPGFSAACLCCDGKPALLVGTLESPIAAGKTAKIRLHYVEGMDKKSCPAIVCCGGRMDFHGSPLSRTWTTLGATANAGTREVELSERVSGWKIGDRVLVTASYGNFGALSPQTEVRRIVEMNGTRLNLDEPLSNEHTGEGEFVAEVANLSRHVVVESADPEEVRGHTMYHAGSAGSISYAELRHLGKAGILGRYPLHYHLCRDSMRGSSVVGASIWDSHNRWIAIHGTEYLVVRDCVGYKSLGHGFFLEDGTEVYNVLDRNLAVAADNADPLPEQALPFDKNDGAGYWWANSHNTFTRNVAVDCAGYGFRYEATPKAGFTTKEKSFGSPRQAFYLSMPVRGPDGARHPVDIRTLPFVRFESNTAHNIANYALNLGQDAGGVGPDKKHPFVVRAMKIWNAQRGYTVHVPHVRIDGMRIHRCGYEVYRARYQGQDYRNVRLSGIRGIYEVFDLDSYLASGQAVRETGVGLNRARLPGFPRGTGAGGNSYQASEVETAVLDPVDDLPPMTVITEVRKVGNAFLIRGTTSDNGELERVTINGQPAKVTANGEWETTLANVNAGLVRLVAMAEDAAGNQETTPHEMTIVVR